MSATDHLLRLLPGSSLMLALQRLRGQGVIALYHRVSPRPDPIYPPVPPALFEEHLLQLRRAFRILTLHELLERRRRGKSLRGCCAVTFDDGYRDFLDHAYPLLRRHGAPATHFLVVDSLEAQRPNWNWRLNRITYVRDGNPCDLSLTFRVAAMTGPEREAYLADQERRLADLPPDPALLRPEDLAGPDPALVEWGSHSVTHANLGCCDPATARRELLESRQRLEALLGRPVRYFAYPNGSYSRAVLRLAEDSGYEAALAVNAEGVTARCPAYALPRFDVGAVSGRKLRWELSGTLGYLRRVRARVRRRRG